MQWNRAGISVSKLKIKNSVIYFCYSHAKDILLLEKNSFSLRQYLDEEDKALSVNIDKDFTNKEVKQILETSENIKSKKELQKYVKIKILERFEIERGKDCKMRRLII